MKLSIITICYNDHDGFLKTAKSVVAQEYLDFEWIVIDGGSTDGSADVIKEYSDHMSYWVSEPDKGIYNAMNKGIRQAKGDYCLFLNSGDMFCSSKSLMRVMSRRWVSDIVSCDMFMGNGRFASIACAPAGASFTRFLRGSLSHQATFIRTSVLREIGYDESYRIVSDWSFWFEALVVRVCSYQSVNIPITIFDTSGVSSAANPKQREERRNFESRYFSPEIIEQIIKTVSIEESIRVAYVSTAERKVLLLFKVFADWFFNKLYNRLSMYYKNIKYREW